ncbi:CoA pyrophosphatase [Sneathiella glossodoripedis]|uniref:CoA pyrophosphatase n=1 Tax=Sneathiella glossodoripedis TaxID=418853 RepID=UPI000AD1EB12|nr:CoA pyrophosphatase [Sneathiella glossodoripedis]
MNNRKILRESFGAFLDPAPTSEAHEEVLRRSFKGDHDLNPASFPGKIGTFKPAAVLVPIVVRDDELSVILTRRSSHMKKHAGQISFPGGRAEDEDDTPVCTALRESREEIGLDPDLVEVIGSLSPYVTVTQYSVIPVVGLVEPAFDLVPEESEVAEIFEVPLDFLMDERNHQKHSGFHNGIERFWYAMPYNDYYIWGATAGMLKDLSERAKTIC